MVNVSSGGKIGVYWLERNLKPICANFENTMCHRSIYIRGDDVGDVHLSSFFPFCLLLFGVLVL